MQQIPGWYILVLLLQGMQGSGIALPVDKLTISLTRKDTVTILQRVNLAHRRKLKSSFQSMKQPEPNPPKIKKLNASALSRSLTV